MNQMITCAGQEQIVDMHTVLVRKPQEMQTLEIPKLYGEDNIKMGLNSECMSTRFICLGIGILFSLGE